MNSFTHSTRLFFLLLLSIADGGSLLCQVSIDDSFRNSIQRSRNGIDSVNSMLAFADHLINNKIYDASCLTWAEQAEKKSIAIKDFHGICKANQLKGIYYFNRSGWNESILAYETVLVNAKNLTDSRFRNQMNFKSLVGLAEVYNYMGDYVSALDYRLKGLKLIDSIQADASEHTSVYVSIANDFRHLNQRSKAIEYLEKAIEYIQDASDNIKLDYYYEYYQDLLLNEQLQESEKMLARYDSGVKYFALTPAQRLESAGIGHKLHGQYQLYHSGNFNKAVSEFKKYLDHSIELDNKTHIAIAYNKLGIAYDSLRQFNKAIEMYRHSFDICVAENIIDYGYKSAFSLAGNYEMTGDFKNAYHYSKFAYALKDTLDSREKLKELNFLEARYESSRKEKQIADLNLANTQQQLESLNKSRMLIIFGIGAFALLLLLGLLYINSRNRYLLAKKEQKINEEQIKTLEKQQEVLSMQGMISGQEAERTRIAKDLHDGLGGLFSTVKMYFSTLEHNEKDLRNNELFRKSFDMVDTAATEVRRIAHNMMPEVLLKMGLMNALTDLCNNITAGKKVSVSLQYNGMEQRLGQYTEIMLYRIVQELLNNIVKHANAGKALVQFIRDGERLSVTVEDDGNGFDTEEIAKGNNIGMETVKSRVAYLEGKIQIDSEPGIGTTVMMDFNLKPS
jgi:signal transduction histidine kinase/Flp pilus assembly protein TadD